MTDINIEDLLLPAPRHHDWAGMQRCRDAGMTQHQIARAFHCSQSTVSLALRGRTS
jgi:Homeodomain-like domain